MSIGRELIDVAGVGSLNSIMTTATDSYFEVSQGVSGPPTLLAATL